MKLHKTEVNIEASQTFEQENFKVGDLSIILDLLSKLYSNPIQTLTQEYICNARDANREVNSTKPITITAPSVLNPIMEIRDYGPGLSEERLKKVFVNYGVSTKSQDNKMTGGFGIGSKSAWAYTDSFTIVSRINGVTATYVAHKTNQGATLSKITEEPTPTERNGVSIQIAVKPQDVVKFKDAISRAIHFWEVSERPELFNLEPSYFDETKGLSLGDNYFLVDNSNYTFEVNFVIDGIPYVYRKEDWDKQNVRSKKRLIIKVANGVLKIAPNREELIYNAETLAQVKVYQLSANTKLMAIEDKLTQNVRQAFSLNSFSDFLEELSILNKYFYINDRIQLNHFLAVDEDFHFSTTANVPNKALFKFNHRRNKKVYESSVLPVKVLDKLYFNDNTQLTKAKQAYARLKIGEGYILNPNNLHYAELLKIFNPKPLSSIDISDYAKTYTPKAVKQANPDRDVTVHLLTSENTTSIQKLYFDAIPENRVYVWLPREETIALTDFNFLRWQKDVVPCYIAKGHVKAIAGNPKFIALKDFISNFKIDNDLILSYVYRSLISEHRNFISYVNKSKKLDSKLKTNFKAFSNTDFKPIDYLLPAVEAEIVKNSYYKSLQKIVKSLGVVLNKCPMLQFVSEYDFSKDSAIVAEYINGQLKGVSL